MKYLIISDIHGSPYYLEQVLNKETFDKLLLLGDILPHGPRNDIPDFYNPKKVIDILNKISSKIIAVKGNCDAYVDEMVLDFPLNELVCININNTDIYLTHGHIYNKSNLLNIKHGIVLHGHFHVNEIKKVNNVSYITIGSITLPKDSHNSYAILEDNLLTIKDINGNVLVKEFINE